MCSIGVLGPTTGLSSTELRRDPHRTHSNPIANQSIPVILASAIRAFMLRPTTEPGAAALPDLAKLVVLADAGGV